MKKLYAEGVSEMIPAGNGFVFSVQQPADENKIVVSYKLYSFESGTVSPVTRNVYLHAKFGEGYKKFERSKRDFLSCRAVQLPDNDLFVVFENGAAAVFRGDEPVWTGDILYGGEGPKDAAYDDGALWFCFSQAGAVIKYNLRGMKEDLRIGGGKIKSFHEPAGIWVRDGMMMLCNTGVRKLTEINLKTYSVADYAEFEEPVLQYLKIGGNEAVRLESGLYRL